MYKCLVSTEDQFITNSLECNFCHTCQFCFQLKDARMSCSEAAVTERMSASDCYGYLGELLQGRGRPGSPYSSVVALGRAEAHLVPIYRKKILRIRKSKQ